MKAAHHLYVVQVTAEAGIGRDALIDALQRQGIGVGVHFLRIPPKANTLSAAQLGRVCEQLAERFPEVAEMFEGAEPEICAFAAFPTEHWRQIWSNNPQERLNREVRRRSVVVGIFPNREAVIWLVGMVLAEQHEWAVGRRSMSAGSLAKLTPAAVVELEKPEEVTPQLMAS